MQPETWEVTVSVNGEGVLTIGSSHLSGVSNIAEYEETVRTCGRHLLSFIGATDGETAAETKEG